MDLPAKITRDASESIGHLPQRFPRPFPFPRLKRSTSIKPGVNATKAREIIEDFPASYANVLRRSQIASVEVACRIVTFLMAATEYENFIAIWYASIVLREHISCRNNNDNGCPLSSIAMELIHKVIVE